MNIDCQTMKNNISVAILGDYITGVGEFIVQLQTEPKSEQLKQKWGDKWDPTTQG